MDDFRLKVFITAARTLSFTRAAEQLCISQPAVSKHVAELEARYGLQLFTRRGSRLELTDAGRTLLDAAERLADDYRRLEYEMSLCTGQTEGELRLGASTTIAQYLLPPLLARFTTRFPQVRVSLLSGNSGQVEQALGDHAIDLGLVESVSRRQGLHYTSAALAERGIRLPQLNVVLRLGSTEGIKRFVRHSDAMAIVSAFSVVDELRSGTLRIVDLDGLPLLRDFVFVHAEAHPAGLVRQFLDFARNDL